MQRVVFMSVLAVMSLVVGGSSVRGQENPIPLPDIDALFADNIEVVAVGLAVDNFHRVAYYYDQDGWQTTSLPRTDDSVPILVAAPPGHQFLYTPFEPYDLGDNYHQDNPQVWELDTKTSAFTRYQGLCGPESAYWYASYLIDAYPEFTTARDWIITNHIQPCSLSSGELQPDIPDAGDVVGYFTGPSLVSPDGQWAILINPTHSEASRPMFYSYHFSTQELTLLLQNVPYWVPAPIAYAEWFPDNRFILHTRYSLRQDSASMALEGTLGVPDSIQNIWRTNIHSEDEYYFADWGRCTQVLQDDNTGDTTEYFMGWICTNGLPMPGEATRVYLGLTPQHSTVIVAINLETGEQETLFTGEVEAIANPSPDGRYLIFYMGSNGQTDVIYEELYRSDFEGQTDPDSADLMRPIIFDRATGEMVVQIERGPATLVWLDNTHLLVKRSGEADELLTLENDVVTSLSLPGTVLVDGLFQNQLLLLGLDRSIFMFDFDSERVTMQLMTAPNLDDLAITAVHLRDDLLEVTFTVGGMPDENLDDLELRVLLDVPRLFGGD